jgi:hypothetical protein
MDKNFNKNYSDFSFEEFLQDDFFIASMNNPTPETAAFWDDFKKKHKGNTAVFDAAKEYLESLHRYYTRLSADEIDEIRQAFFKKRIGTATSIKKFIYTGISAAASIALIFIFALQVKTKKQTADDNSAVFAIHDSKDSLDREIRLMISDHKTMTLSQEESVITYDDAGIEINQTERISKKESSSYNQLIVPFGKRSRLHLSDGSKVWVNSDSRLKFPVSFEDSCRVISVEGEIYIEVAPDEKRPFIVQTNEVDIRVLGTKFNVTAYEDDPEKRIVLVSGSVQIKSTEKETVLSPNQMYSYNTQQSRIDIVNTQKYTSWIDGIYYCENESLGTIFQRLSRYYGTRIMLDETLAPVIFSGKLDLKENLSDILDGIAFTLPITYIEKDGSYTVSLIE